MRDSTMKIRREHPVRHPRRDGARGEALTGRLTDLSWADQIIHVKNGLIVEMGTPEELRTKSGPRVTWRRLSRATAGPIHICYFVSLYCDTI